MCSYNAKCWLQPVSCSSQHVPFTISVVHSSPVIFTEMECGRRMSIELNWGALFLSHYFCKGITCSVLLKRHTHVETISFLMSWCRNKCWFMYVPVRVSSLTCARGWHMLTVTYFWPRRYKWLFWRGSVEIVESFEHFVTPTRDYYDILGLLKLLVYKW